MASFRAIFQAHLDDLVVGTLSESVPLMVQWSGTGAVGEIDSVDLVNGNNTMTPPTGTRLWIFIPPAGNGTALVLKGIAGDTGIAIRPADATILGVNSLSPFIVNAAGAVAGCRVIWL